MKTLGIILIALGIIGLAYQGFSYTRREQVAKIGSFEATADKQEHVFIPPLVSGVVLVAGVALLLVGNKTHSSA